MIISNNDVSRSYKIIVTVILFVFLLAIIFYKQIIKFIDIFLFFGIIGLIIYLLFIKRIFFTTYYSKYKILLFIALMLVVVFAGNFFMSIISSIFAYTVFQNMEYLHEDYNILSLIV